MNPLDPRHMSTKERLSTVCQILATGILRLRVRDAQMSVATGQFGLHFPPPESGHANAHGESA